LREIGGAFRRGRRDSSSGPVPPDQSGRRRRARRECPGRPTAARGRWSPTRGTRVRTRGELPRERDGRGATGNKACSFDSPIATAGVLVFSRTSFRGGGSVTL